jgi:hypothetical protein
MRQVFVSFAAAALVVSPVAAQPVDRTSAGMESAQSERLGGSPMVTIVIIFAVLAGLLLLAGGNDNPTSP